MNSKVAKILRKFAETEKLPYKRVKLHFEMQDEKTQKQHLMAMQNVIILRNLDKSKTDEVKSKEEGGE